MDMYNAMIGFADKHLAPYTLRGDELIPDYCPICHGGDNRDRYTFALNLTEGIYVCKRGSCGARGRFEELARRFGEQAEIIRPPGKARKQYVLPEVELKPLTDEIIGYFLADNLMTALSDSDEETKAQGKFANALKKFATRYHVHVLLVAHPRKVKQGEKLGQDDIGGSSATIRLADSAIVVERPNLRVLKNRDGGVCRLIECCYCPDSRRIYQADKGDLCRFSWNRDGITPPDPRADSLPEYAVRMAESVQPF